MTAWDGMRDAGKHHFELSFVSYDRPLRQTDVCAVAEDYNRGFEVLCGDIQPVSMPEIQTDGLTVTAFKPSEDGCNLVVRLADLNGGGGSAVIRGEFQSAFAANLLEENLSPLKTCSGEATVHAKPFEIVTVILQQ